MKAEGFTLIELVVTILLLGIVAAAAGPRFFQVRTFDSRGFYDRATATVRFAQKTAVAWRRDVFVCVTASPARVTAGTAAGCAVPLVNPVGGAAATHDAPPGVTLNVVEFSFDGLGRPSAGVTITFTSTIAGDPARQITVAAETGYVAAN